MLGQICNLLMENLAPPVLPNEVAEVETPVQVASGSFPRHQIAHLLLGLKTLDLPAENLHPRRVCRVKIEQNSCVIQDSNLLLSHQCIGLYCHLLAI